MTLFSGRYSGLVRTLDSGLAYLRPQPAGSGRGVRLRQAMGSFKPTGEQSLLTATPSENSRKTSNWITSAELGIAFAQAIWRSLRAARITFVGLAQQLSMRAKRSALMDIRLAVRIFGLALKVHASAGLVTESPTTPNTGASTESDERQKVDRFHEQPSAATPVTESKDSGYSLGRPEWDRGSDHGD